MHSVLLKIDHFLAEMYSMKIVGAAAMFLNLRVTYTSLKASAFGVIYISLIDYFNTTRQAAAWIGSVSFGVTKITGPLSSTLISRIGIQKTVAIGTLLAFSGCFISWFATGIAYLYVSYGVVMGFGLGLVLVPSMMIVVQHFRDRVGLANAIGSMGNGLGTLVLPPLYTYLLEEYGWRGTLLLLSGIVLNGLVCAVIFIPSQYLKCLGSTSRRIKSNDCSNFISLSRNPHFVWYTVGTAMGFLGYNIPFVHLPDMAVQKGVERYEAAYLVSIMGVSGIVGRLIFGWISDFPCVNVILLQGVSLLVCGVATAVCPHLTEFYSMAVYSAMYGAFIGVFASFVPVVLLILVGLDHTGDGFGIIQLPAGIMTTVSSPLAGWLFDETGAYNVSFYVASCTLILAGIMQMLLLILHQRQIRQQGDDKENT